MTARCAIYSRVSRDKTGAGLGVDRQERDCRELAARNGWSVVEGAVYADNDTSAYSGKVRKGYRKLIAAVRSGAVDTVLVWHTDRLHRSPIELEEWITACEPHGVAVHTVKAGPLDLATPAGRMVARQLGAVARYESEHRSERVKAAKDEAGANGAWRGGRRPFGYEVDGLTVREAEAKIVADCTERVLAGESLHSVARDLNTREIKTSAGNTWKPTELRSLLLRARNAGIVRHGGAEVTASWPPIVDPGQWRAVVRLLSDESRRPPRSADERWLGSGLYLCGHPSHEGEKVTMISATSRSRSGAGHAPAYSCRTGRHLTRVAEPLDHFVGAVVIERLSRPDAHLLLTEDSRRARAELTAWNRRRREIEELKLDLSAERVQGLIDGAQMAEATRLLRVEADDLDRRIAAATAVSPLSGYADAEDVAAAWKGATVGRKKAIIRELFVITLLPAPKGRPAGWKTGDGYFDPRYVRVEPRR